MALPATVSTNLWPDHKNTTTGPFPRLSQVKQDVSSGSIQGIGNSTSQEQLLQSFKSTTGGMPCSVDLHLGKTGSPTDNIVVKLYLGDDLTDAAFDGVLMATSAPIAASSIPAIAGWVKIPLTTIDAQTIAADVKHWIVVSRTGSVDASNNIHWSVNASNPYADGKLRKFSQADGYADISTTDARFKVNLFRSAKYQFAVDKTNNKIRAYKSTDNQSWSEVDSANAPAVSSTSNLKSMSVSLNETTIAVFVITSSSRLDIFNFSPDSETWGSSAFNTTSPTFNTNVSGVAPMISGVRGTSAFPSALSDHLFLNNGATESVMGNARRRVTLSRRLVSDGTWAIQAVSATGVAVDHDARTALVDGNGVFHVFWTASDDGLILHGTYSLTNSFTGPNGMNSATVDQTVAYPVGIPCNFIKSGEWWIAVPYVQSGQLKVSRCKASIAGTSGNWTNTSVGSTTVETAASNPCVLIWDNGGSGRIFAFYRKTDGKIYFSHDKGADDWVTEQEFHPGTKTVTGLSGFNVCEALGLGYFDTTPTPDELRYDQVEVFF